MCSSDLWKCRTGELGEATLPGGGDWGFPLTMGGRLIVFAGGVPIRRDGDTASTRSRARHTPGRHEHNVHARVVPTRQGRRRLSGLQ